MAAPLTSVSLEESAEELSRGVMNWEGGSFGYLRTLQKAVRNRGSVELMRCKKEGADSGRLVAVKRMPTAWVQHGPSAHEERFKYSSERPWRDLGILQELNRRSFPAACELLGVFRDETVTYVVTSLATEGELFAWCQRAPAPGREREALMMPLVAQVLSAVQRLHEHGIAHRDLSLENILLTRTDAGGLEVKLIDFGMGGAERMCLGGRADIGKPSYQAPEMHLGGRYDAFLADAFALGVVIFTMAAREYPWAATKRGKCERYQCFHFHGWEHFAEEMTLRDNSGRHLCQVFSEELSELIGGLLVKLPEGRAHLGESIYQGLGGEDSEESDARCSVWDLRWHVDGISDVASEREDLDRLSLDEADSSPGSSSPASLAVVAEEDPAGRCGRVCSGASAGSSKSASTAATSRSASPRGGNASPP